MHIPFTKEYIEYLTACIKDALTKTKIDGFMLDWFFCPPVYLGEKERIRWLDCEKQMYAELFGRPFPGKDKIGVKEELEFQRRALNRCWDCVHKAAKSVKPDCVIWLSCFNLRHPQAAGSRMFQELDWLMNENPNPASLAAVRKEMGPNTKIVQCLCGWGDLHDPRKVVGRPEYDNVGFYGFAEADVATTLPRQDIVGNVRNIKILRDVYHGKTLDVDLKKRAEELKRLKWGMFVCWSFSTFSGKEWTPGVKDISLFHPKGCDTDQWARTAKEAGMGYMVFLTKHHDGFCLWDTKTTDRKATKSCLGKDVLAEVRRSCDKYGLKLAIYFSEAEWAWPNYPDGKRFIVNGGRKPEHNGGYNPELKKAQLRELLTEYGPVEFLWLDYAVGDGGLSHKDTVALVKSLQPGCFVGFNDGDQQDADIRLAEMGRPGPPSDPATAPNIKVALGKKYLLAEFTNVILPVEHEGGAYWFYSLPKYDNLCLPAEKIFRDYVEAAKYGNIFSLDFGPDYEGRLRKIDVETLQKVGRMIRSSGR